MLNVYRMRLLREVASHGSIAAAARALYVTPSAVSQQLTLLENETGIELLEHVGRGVRLTYAGETLVSHAEEVLAALEKAEADLEAIVRGVAGPIRTSAFPTAARALLVPALALLKKEHPRLSLSMLDLEPEQSLPLLTTGELDLVLTYGFDRLPERTGPGTERVLLLTEPIYIAVPSSHPAAQASARVADFSEEEWIVGHEGSSLMEVVRRIANDAGFEPRVNLRSNDYQVILSAVQAGLGVSIAPPIALFADYPGVVLREPTDVHMHRYVHAVIRRGSSGRPAVAAAIAALKQVARSVGAAEKEAEVTTALS
ncbi:MAG: LysR family transcriptional regulator [Coriobacteriales bacterium]